MCRWLVDSLLATHSPLRLTAPLTPPGLDLPLVCPRRRTKLEAISVPRLRSPRPALSSSAPWPTATSRAESSRFASRSGRPLPRSLLRSIAPSPAPWNPILLFLLVINLSRISICAGDSAAPQRTRFLITASRYFSLRILVQFGVLLLFWTSGLLTHMCCLILLFLFPRHACSARD